MGMYQRSRRLVSGAIPAYARNGGVLYRVSRSCGLFKATGDVRSTKTNHVFLLFLEFSSKGCMRRPGMAASCSAPSPDASLRFCGSVFWLSKGVGRTNELGRMPVGASELWILLRPRHPAALSDRKLSKEPSGARGEGAPH